MGTKLFYFVVLVGILTTCKVTFVPIYKSSYNGNDFRLDGYYYSLDKRDFVAKLYIYFFYPDGTVLFWGNSDYDTANVEETLLQLERFFKMEKRNNAMKGSHYDWSAFEVKDKNISLKSWAMSENFKKGTYESSLTIINDSLLIENNSSFQDYWHFKKFADKPNNSSCPIKDKPPGVYR